MNPNNQLAVVDFIRSLSTIDKESALIELIQLAINQNGSQAPLPLRDNDGQAMGYFIPQTLADEKLAAIYSTLTSKDIQRTKNALQNLDDTMDMDEFMSSLTTEAQ